MTKGRLTQKDHLQVTQSTLATAQLGGIQTARTNSSELRTRPRCCTVFLGFLEAHVYNGAPSLPLVKFKRFVTKSYRVSLVRPRGAIWKQTTCGSIPDANHPFWNSLKCKPALFPKLETLLTLLSQWFPFRREGWDLRRVGQVPQQVKVGRLISWCSFLKTT